MKHFILFIIFIFSGLAAYYYNKEDRAKSVEDKKIHVYASSSFVAKWGPAPALKELFERQSIFKVEFVESPDLGMTIQKISFENETSLVDVVLGMDQFDLARLANKIKWKPIDRNQRVSYVDEVKGVTSEKSFLPYDWAPISFVARKSLKQNIGSLKDLLAPGQFCSIKIFS